MSRRVKKKTRAKAKAKANGAATTSASAARALLRKADEDRVTQCGAAVDLVLKKFRCTLQGVPAFAPTSPGMFGIGVKVQIVTIDEEPTSG